MPAPTFQHFLPEQFEQLLQKFPFTRKIDAVLMHHTWRPRHQDFRGHDTIVSMWRHHTQVNGWSDIAQHITIDPQGMIWLGRNWNLPPASAAGHNGNKSCPGGALVYDDILDEVDHVRQELGANAAREPAGQHPLARETDRAIAESIRSLTRITDNAAEPGDAELSHEEHDTGFSQGASRSADAFQSRDSGPGAAILSALRPYLVNLRSSRLSGEGEAASTPEDVDAIFEQHLQQAVKELHPDLRLPLLFYAHGGLVSEASGLQIAHKHIGWWRRNNIYPVYFIWETGLFETIGQLLGRAQKGSRALRRDLADFTTDPLIEIGARVLQGPRIWGGMKASAEHAMDEPAASGAVGGGAHYVAAKLKAFCDAHPGRVELHAVGHSAGSIFHTYFLPLAREMGVPTFKTGHFLAPVPGLDFAALRFCGDPAHAADLNELPRQACMPRRHIARPGRLEAFALAALGDARLDGDTVSRPCVESIRTARRVGPSGQIVFDLVAEIIQERHVGASTQAPAFTCYGGATVILGPTGEVRYVVMKNVASAGKLHRRRDFFKTPCGQKYWHLVNNRWQAREGIFAMVQSRECAKPGVF